MQETWVQFLGWEDLLEKEMATHSSILAWRIPWSEEPGEPQTMGSQRVGHDWATNTYFSTSECPRLHLLGFDSALLLAWWQQAVSKEVVLYIPKKDQFVVQSEFSWDSAADCVTMDELDSFFEPPFLHLWNGDNHTYNS